ncbi:hypothetical protein [uncultured Gimesia sp.]|uniref:hypothetical protein n=1 Tax=uncultured Gimesia sp. TaxID=1678688 RepID=UPI002638C2EC|nr:hypothetical protein [uncultured Gimesia sp.]
MKPTGFRFKFFRDHLPELDFKSVSNERQRIVMNLKRGLQKSVLLGLVGFLIPVALLSIPRPKPTASQSRSERQDRIKLREHLTRFKLDMMIHSGLQCAAVFAFAAFAAYAPHKGIRFMRSLIIISSVTVLSQVVAGIYFPTPKMIAKSILIDPGIPMGAAVITMVIIVIVNVSNNARETTETP